MALIEELSKGFVLQNSIPNRQMSTYSFLLKIRRDKSLNSTGSFANKS